MICKKVLGIPSERLRVITPDVGGGFGLKMSTFAEYPLVLIAANAHPLAAGGQIELAALGTQRFILRERGSGTRMAIDAHFKRLGFKPDLRLELGSNEAIKEAVAGGLGVSVISSHALHGQAAEHGVAVLEVGGFPIASHWHVVRQKGKQLSPIAKVFLAHLLAQSGQWRSRGEPAGTSSS